MGSFFWGYLGTQLIGGVLAEKFGGHLVVFFAIFVSAILNGLSPLAADLNLWYFIAVRVGIGLACVSNTSTDRMY